MSRRKRFDPDRAVPNRELFLVNLRDRLCCRVCGKPPEKKATYHRGFEYHHLQHRAAGGPDVAENLIVLCYGCHDKHHRQPDKIELPASAGNPPDNFACGSCGETLDPRRVVMNCGWYRCGYCDEKVHLFDHFGFEEAIPE